MFHNSAKDHRLQMLPLDVALGDRDEVGAQEDAVNAVDREKPRRQGRCRCIALGAEIRGSIRQNVPPRNELECRRLGVASV